MTRSMIKWLLAGLLSVAPVPVAVVWAEAAHAASTDVNDSVSSTTVPSPVRQPLLIQGAVVAVESNWITVHTPDIRPTCAAGKPCPQFIIAGTNFRVNAQHAVYEAANGQPTTAIVKVGDDVVVYGTTSTGATVNHPNSTMRSMDARIIERIVIPIKGA